MSGQYRAACYTSFSIPKTRLSIASDEFSLLLIDLKLRDKKRPRPDFRESANEGTNAVTFSNW